MPEHADKNDMSVLKKFYTTAALVLGLIVAIPVSAQGLFDPVVTVNDGVVTEFEVQQRQAFLTALNSNETSREFATNALVDERLRAQAISNAGLEITEETLRIGLEEFAGRANMSVDDLIATLESGGIARETLVDFVRVGVSWRNFINARFRPRLEVTEAEIDRALGSGSAATAIRVLVSEIIIPAQPERVEEVRALAEEIAATTSTDEFSAYARQYSATATRDQGGRLPWQALSNLPPVLRPLLLGLSPGEVTAPLTIPNAVAVFQLRGIEETGAPNPVYAAIDYAAYYIPGGRSSSALAQAEKLSEEIDVCNDLYGVAQDQPPEVLERVIRPPSEIPTDIALELSKLDSGEVSTALTRNDGQTLVFLMMCGRTDVANEEADRAEVANSLRNNRLAAFAESYLEQLRADARIIYR